MGEGTLENIKISVRNLVEFVLRSGDLSSGQYSPKRALEGIKAHQHLQSIKGRYIEKEVSVKLSYPYKDMVFELSGRIDGLALEDEIYVIDEIKSTLKNADDCEENEVHMAQGKFYGYMYCLKEDLKEIKIRLTYFGIKDESLNSYERLYKIEELEDYVRGVIHRYTLFLDIIRKLRKNRDESIKSMDFPFDTYRAGQKKMMEDSYRAIRHKKRLFVKAPTGIGKTISTLFPAIKSMIYEENEKIFYLTSKTINREAAKDTISLMVSRGLKIRAIILTAKEKICPFGKCDMEGCEYAKGYFDRINNAITDILENSCMIDRDTVIKYSESHKVCPFEFSLDTSLFCDIVICDYNYAFDPSVFLKRFFMDESGNYVFLMDEAHNFIDRARSMYSETLQKQSFLKLRKSIKKEIEGKSFIAKELDDIIKSTSKVNSQFLRLRAKDLEDKVFKDYPKGLFKASKDFIEAVELYLASEEYAKQESYYDELMEVYFQTYSFLRIGEFYGDGYVTILYENDKDTAVKLYCVDPSQIIKENLKRCIALVAFSATLIPASYYIEMMGGFEDAVYLMLDSPFPRENLLVMVDRSVSTRYAHRDKGAKSLAFKIYEAIQEKKGNYMVFFPSYEYMEKIYSIFTQEFEDVEIFSQSRDMKDAQREDFLGSFELQSHKLVLAFAVMGGIFSEGIDLKGERLSGAIVVGVGLAKASLELDLIYEHFEALGKNGFDYAYRYSAMNKVMQSGGRVIRTETDKGFILLMDDRFLNPKYRALMPREWNDFKILSKPDDIKNMVRGFWDEAMKS